MKRVRLPSLLQSAVTGLVVVLTATPASTAQTPAAPPQTSPVSAAGNISASPTSAPKGLPMWVIRDADSTIYLTGTVHLLPDGVEWRSEKLDNALHEAREVWLELAEFAAPEGLNAAVLSRYERELVSSGPPLSSLLTGEENANLDHALEQARLPPDVVKRVQSMKPAYAIYATGRIHDVGPTYHEENGIDRALARMAVNEGIPVKGLETLEAQVGPLMELPEEVQLSQLKWRLTDKPTLKASLTRVADLAYVGWARGDTNLVEAMAQLNKMSGDIEGLDLLNRNENWAGQIETMLKGSGVTLIAVGALHLVGPDSLQSRLKLRGIKAERY